MSEDTHWIEASIDIETEQAVRVREMGDGEPMWLPKSQINIRWQSKKSGLHLIEVPMWLAVKKGLV